jgi:8-oxo-dGTP diphosphatase
VQTVTVAAGVLVERGQVLLTQRKAGGHLAGAWEFPGGKVEAGEDPREALRRELREELGIETTVGEIVDVTFHRYVEADKAVMLLFFEASLCAGSPAPRAVDVAAFEWATAEALVPERFPPADVAVLAKVRARLPPPGGGGGGEHIEGEVVRTGSVRVELPPEEALPLFTAKGETLWVPGWSPTYVTPRDGEPRDGGVWLTKDDDVEVIWRVQRYDAVARVAEYLRVVPRNRVAVVRVECEPEGDGTRATVTYRVTPLSDAGRTWLASFGEADYEQMMREWEGLIAAWLGERRSRVG